MKFFNMMLPGQRLLIIKTNTPTPPACPVLAQSVPKRDPLYLVILLIICAWLSPIVNAISDIGDRWPPPIWTQNRPKIVVLGFLAGVVASVILEDIAVSYVSRVLGV